MTNLFQASSTIHLCVDMKRLFQEDTPWKTPWMGRVAPIVMHLAREHAASTSGMDFPASDTPSWWWSCGGCSRLLFDLDGTPGHAKQFNRLKEVARGFQMTQLAGRNVVVTGGTTGIGRAISIELARAGANILLFGRHQEQLEDALDALKGSIGQIDGMVADQSKPGDVRKVFARAREMGELSAVIVNAGVSVDGLVDVDDNEWRYGVETNLMGCLDVAKRAAEAFGGKSGDIVLIGSVSAEKRSKGTSVYTATKAGIQGFADSFRKEMGEKGIRVSLIEPGAVGSDMQDSSPEEQRAKISKDEMLKAEDIAELVAFILTRPSRCNISAARMEERVQS